MTIRTCLINSKKIYFCTKIKHLHENSNIDLLTNKHEFELIFKQYYRQLCSFAFGFMKQTDDAEEIVQDVFVNLWKNKDSLHITVSLKAYLFLSVRNACLNKLKHIKIREQYKQFNQDKLNNSFDDVQKSVESDETEQAIWKAIDKMPKERRKVFVLSRFDGLSYKEIAEKLNISTKTVENQISAALKFLRIELKKYIVILLPFFVGTIGVISFLIVLLKSLKN